MENIPPISTIEEIEETTATKIIDPEYNRPIKQNETVASIAAREAADLLGYSVEISTGEELINAKTDNELHHVTEVFHTAYERTENLHGRDKVTGESWKDSAKCLEIATCIMNGIGIRPDDQQYLIEHNPELYAEAISQRVRKEEIAQILGAAKPEVLSPGEATTVLTNHPLASRL